jgi:hypothetical protein
LINHSSYKPDSRGIISLLIHHKYYISCHSSKILDLLLFL